MALPLPGKTAERIGRRPGPDDNTGLWLDKLVYRKRDGWELTAGARSFALGQLCHPRLAAAGADALARRREALRAEGVPVVEIRAAVNGRLLVDYGRANALETTVSFHPVWGVPRIPGSALKGVCRAALEREIASGDAAEITPAELEDIFGTAVDVKPARAGQVAFHDGLPEGGAFELALDVLTPHHSSYYRSKGAEPPGDWESPIPHTFVTVVSTTFVFHLSACRRDGARPSESEKEVWQRLIDLACSGIRSALELDGVGAKTSAGYGRFAGITCGSVS